jgi:ATP-dependent Clp protease ATP-binding subunit ClpC
VRLETIAFDPRGTPAEVESLKQHYERIRDRVESADWQERKQNALATTAAPGFWRSPERFGILGEAEYLDRVESGLRTAGSLLERIAGATNPSRAHYRRDLVGRVAQQLYLLDAACCGVSRHEPRDVFMLLEGERGAEGKPSNAFALRLGNMYRGWASKRRMQLQVLEESGNDGKHPYRLLLAISGYGAFQILRGEDGLHILELPEGESFRRIRARVRVAAQPDEPGEDAAALRRQAEAALRDAPTAKLAIVRRYRESPSPLVRDAMRRWRTGKLSRVLEGDFDLIVETPRVR